MYQDTEIIDRLSRVKFFASFDHAKLSQLVTAPQNSIKTFSEGEYVFKEDQAGESMFVILDGIVDVFVRGEHHQREINIATLHKGDFFGEVCVFDEDTERRTASVKATTTTTCFELHKDLILGHTQPIPSSQSPLPDVVRKNALLYGLTDAEKDTASEWLGQFVFKQDEHIYRPGDDINCFYILNAGVVEIVKLDAYGGKHMDVHVHEREYFGAADIVDERLQSRMSFATVVSDQADVYKVSRGILEKLLVQNPKLKSYIKNMYKVRQLKEANS